MPTSSNQQKDKDKTSEHVISIQLTTATATATYNTFYFFASFFVFLSNLLLSSHPLKNKFGYANLTWPCLPRIKGLSTHDFKNHCSTLVPMKNKTISQPIAPLFCFRQTPVV
ncbi:hypothetical protein V6Z11_D08G180700 [Gossypium hirsutum]